MKKLILITTVLALSILASAQLVPRLETTIKIVNNKARIAVTAIGGPITGNPTGTTFSVAIPVANAAASMTAPTILDPLRVPTLLTTPIGNYSDATYEYFNLGYTGNPGSVTFADGVEYELLELNFVGLPGSTSVTLVTLPDGNPAAPDAASSWYNFLEVSGAIVSDPLNLFYQSATSGAPTQPGDYSAPPGVVGFVTSTSLITLPATFINFSGYKNGSKNSLLWTTASESNNRGFEVLRSTDGTNYSSIGFVNSLALDGTSATNISYSFDDNNLAGKKQYYRLKQTDLDNRSKLSNIVLINGAKPLTLAIAGLFPNPASAEVNVIIDTPGRDNVTLVVSDIYGKTVKQKAASVETGSNTIPVDISALAKGSYLVKVVCKSSDCEGAVSKFVKQ